MADWRSKLEGELRAIETLEDGWYDDRSPTPTKAHIETARSIVANLSDATGGGVGPTSAGDIKFEWELGRLSVYVTVLDDDMAHISVFDDDHDYVDLELPPKETAAVVQAVLSGRAIAA